MNKVVELILRLWRGGARRSCEQAAVRVNQRFELVKFDGEPPRPGELKEPAEIIEGGDDIERRVVYRQGEGSVKKLFTGEPSTGHAVLAKEENRA